MEAAPVAKVLPGIVDVLSQISGTAPMFITPRTLLVKHLGLDSLDLVEVEQELSIHFNVEFMFHRADDYSVQEIMNQLNDLLV